MGCGKDGTFQSQLTKVCSVAEATKGSSVPPQPAGAGGNIYTVTPVRRAWTCRTWRFGGLEVLADGQEQGIDLPWATLGEDLNQNPARRGEGGLLPSLHPPRVTSVQTPRHLREQRD